MCWQGLALHLTLAAQREERKDRGKSRLARLLRAVAARAMGMHHATPPPELQVSIDFDEAAREWRANKKAKGASFVYVCGMTTRAGKRCQRRVKGAEQRCYAHGKPVHPR